MESGAATATLSKKLSSGYGVSGRSAYDGVFAAPIKLRPPSFSSQLGDYREIFGSGGSGACSSIPMLELPDLDDMRAAMDDVRRSELDYSKVFGGFGDVDAAVPLEELVAQTKEAEDSFTGRVPARSKVKSGNQSCPEDRTDCSKEIPVASRSSNDAKRINMSYHKVSHGSQNGTNGKTHIAQVHAVPAYTCLIEDVNSVKMNRTKKPTPVAVDTCSGSYCNEGIKEAGHCTKSFTGPSPDNAKNQSSNHGVKVKHRSNSVDLFYDDCEISSGGNGAHHPKVPPSETMAGKLDNNNGDAMRSKATKCQASKSGAPEGASGADSPSYLDEVVDSNSVAAASVAALRKAIEEAQVRMKVAKESMRRKKESFPDRVKRKSNIDLKAGGKRGAKLENKTMKPEEMNTMPTFGEMDTLLQVSSELRKPMMRIEQVRSNLGAKEMFVGKEAVQEAQVKLRSSQAEHLEDVEQKEADHKGKVLELKEAENTEKVACIKSTGRNASEKPETSDHTVEVVKESGACEETSDHTVEVVKESGASEKPETSDHTGACEELFHDAEYRLQEVVDETNLIQETLSNGTTVKRLTDNEDGDVENEVTPFHEPEEYESNLGQGGFIIGNKEKVACEPEDSKMVEGPSELEGCQFFFRATQDLGEGEKRIVQEQKGSEDNIEVSIGVEECELTEFLEPVDNERASSCYGSDSTSMEKGIENMGCLEDRNRRNECSFLDLNHETRHSCQRDATDNTFSNVHVPEILEDILDHVHDDEEIYERNAKDCELDGNGTVQDAQAREDEFKGATHLEDSERGRKDNTVPVEVLRVTQTGPNYEETKTGEAVNATETSSSYEPDETEYWRKTQIADTIIENDEILEVTLDDIMVASKASFQHQAENDCNRSMLVEETTPESVEVCKDTEEATVASNNGEPDMKARQNEDQCFEKAENDCPAVLVDETTKSVEMCEDAKEATFATNIGETDLNARQNQDQCLGKAENDCNPAAPVEETTSESEEICTDAMETRFASDKEIDEKRSNSSTEEILFDNKDKIDASQIPTISASESSSLKKVEVKSMIMEEKGAIGKSTKVELEKEHLKKIDEAKEREREREKEKLAVERAIREARERAFANARGRAALERAAAEARQRNISDGRERLGKVSSQANEKTPAEKAAMEAKLKAERAAVERATAEARARALERALSEKAASEGRNKSDKSFAEKYFGSSRDNGKKQNFQSKSFSYGVRDSTDAFEGANGDSAQRCKARSERHQRIGERVAKALEEKNMRDRLVQKEQEERNRVAEVLDADVKRWSSGKTGNLRALLSTLQYILGPDSGWQPIPLTEIVATTAVKKAYRKATLFVHPDKLQQRGASIQQKYICEKVFDLLKEAWNRFNMEER